MLRFEQMGSAHSEVLGELGVSRGSRKPLRQVAPGFPDLKPQLLRGPADVHLPALVTEMTLDLARDARGGIGREALADVGIAVVDGLQQPDSGDLHPTFLRLRSIP